MRESPAKVQQIIQSVCLFIDSSTDMCGNLKTVPPSFHEWGSPKISQSACLLVDSSADRNGYYNEWVQNGDGEKNSPPTLRTESTRYNTLLRACQERPMSLLPWRGESYYETSTRFRDMGALYRL